MPYGALSSADRHGGWYRRHALYRHGRNALTGHVPVQPLIGPYRWARDRHLVYRARLVFQAREETKGTYGGRWPAA